MATYRLTLNFTTYYSEPYSWIWTEILKPIDGPEPDGGVDWNTLRIEKLED
jgi:hypothetical protein